VKKIEAVNRAIQTEKGTFLPGQPFEVDAEEAKWLIAHGFAKEAKTGEKPKTPPPSADATTGGDK